MPNPSMRTSLSLDPIAQIAFVAVVGAFVTRVGLKKSRNWALASQLTFFVILTFLRIDL